MEFVAATNNKGKLEELRRIMQGMGHNVLSLSEINLSIDPEETGETFQENAIIKAKEVCEIINKPVIADDSGIVVDYLNGAPGVHSARYCGEHGNDEGNNDKLLKDLQDVPKELRSAKFVSVVAIYLPNGSTLTALGECHGWIGFERKGTNGFGYDPIFNIREYNDKSYAQLTSEEKDKISHRGRALAEMQLLLKSFLERTNKCSSNVGAVGGYTNAHK